MPQDRGYQLVRGAVAVALGAWLLGAAAATAAVAESAAGPRVVVTIKPIHSIVERVMQGVGSPVLIVDGASSPHTFSVKPSAAKAIATADVFIGVSRELEPFSGRLIAALPPTAETVSVVDIAGLTLYPRREGGVFEAHDHDEHSEERDRHHDHGDKAKAVVDGHVWLDPKNAEVIAVAIAARLSARYPAVAETLKANASSVVADIKRLDTEIRSSLTAVRDKPFIVFHDGTQYFERHYGIAAAGSITLGPDVQPSGKRIAEVRKRIKELGAACVFAEPSYQESQLAAVTEGTAARFGTIDVEGQMLSPSPDLYFVLMRGIAGQLRECLERSAAGN